MANCNACGHEKALHGCCEAGEYCKVDGCRCVDGHVWPTTKPVTSGAVAYYDKAYGKVSSLTVSEVCPDGTTRILGVMHGSGADHIQNRISELEAKVDRLKRSTKESRVWESDETRALKEAVGVKMEGQSNGGLAPRDYKVACNTRDLVVCANGYFIWWCSSHRQPHPWCESGKADQALVKAHEEINQLKSRERLLMEMIRTVADHFGEAINFFVDGACTSAEAKSALLREALDEDHVSLDTKPGL